MNKRFNVDKQIMVVYAGVSAVLILLFAVSVFMDPVSDNALLGTIYFSLLLILMLAIFAKYSYVIMSDDELVIVIWLFFRKRINIKSINRVAKKSEYGGFMNNVSLFYKDEYGSSKVGQLVPTIIGEKPVVEILKELKRANGNIKFDLYSENLVKKARF